MKIVAFRSKEDLDIEFMDDYHYKKTTTYSNFKNGEIKNPYDKTVCGVAYLGVGDYKTREVKDRNTHEYIIWRGIIVRCYGEYYKEKYPSYFNKITVCNEWLNFQNFARWYNEHKYKCDGRLHIDKDILHPESKEYAPENCLLIPQRINMLFVSHINKYRLPSGISKTKTGRYQANCGNYRLGTYDTLNMAYDAYANKKEEIIRKVADEYKNIIPKEVYEALYNYKVDLKNNVA